MLNDASAGTIVFKHDVKSTGTRCRPLFFHHRYSTTHWQARSPSSTTASSLAALYLLATLLWGLWLWSVASGSIVLWRWLRRLVAGVSCDHVWVLSYLSFSSSCSSSLIIISCALMSLAVFCLLLAVFSGRSAFSPLCALLAVSFCSARPGLPALFDLVLFLSLWLSFWFMASHLNLCSFISVLSPCSSIFSGLSSCSAALVYLGDGLGLSCPSPLPAYGSFLVYLGNILSPSLVTNILSV